jgi:hypothetical protein
VRAQSLAATLLWPYDCKQARAIYRRAFQSLVCNVSATPNAFDDLCKPGHAEIEGKISVQVKSQVFDQVWHTLNPHRYNVDRLIPPELGGSNSLKNLWPEPLAGEWAYHMKSRMAIRVPIGRVRPRCSGTIT